MKLINFIIHSIEDSEKKNRKFNTGSNIEIVNRTTRRVPYSRVVAKFPFKSYEDSHKASICVFDMKNVTKYVFFALGQIARDYNEFQTEQYNLIHEIKWYYEGSKNPWHILKKWWISLKIYFIELKIEKLLGSRYMAEKDFVMKYL